MMPRLIISTMYFIFFFICFLFFSSPFLVLFLFSLSYFEQQNKRTALHAAAYNGHYEIVKALLVAGAVDNIPDAVCFLFNLLFCSFTFILLL